MFLPDRAVNDQSCDALGSASKCAGRPGKYRRSVPSGKNDLIFTNDKTLIISQVQTRSVLADSRVPRSDVSTAYSTVNCHPRRPEYVLAVTGLSKISLATQRALVLLLSLVPAGSGRHPSRWLFYTAIGSRSGLGPTGDSSVATSSRLREPIFSAEFQRLSVPALKIPKT